LIVYSGSAHLVMPLTRDQRIINAMVEGLTPELMPVDGDSLDQAMDLAGNVLRKAGAPGSVLVISDTVARQQVQALSAARIDMPVQFLAVQSASAKVDQGMQSAAAALGASVVKLTIDPSDVERVDRRAKSEFISAAGTYEGQRWQDSGYALLPLIAAGVLLWSRKGWIVRG
jgi:Ca-activated chloride channel family protein